MLTSDEELEDLLLDETAFNDYFTTLDPVQPLKQVKEDLIVQNNGLSSNQD